MPYIPNNGRSYLDKAVEVFLDCRTVFHMEKIIGRLNYFLFKLAKKQCHCYSDYAAFIGELESAKLEIYRRQIAPYEDKKIEINGDVE